MYTRISTFVALLLALTAVSAGAAQIYTMFDGSLDTAVPQVYVLAVHASTPASEDQSATKLTVPNLVDEETVIGNDGVLNNLACGFSAAPGLTKGWLVHVVVNGVLSALTCGVTNTTTGRSCSDTVNTITVPAGTRIALQITPFGTPANNNCKGNAGAVCGTCTVLFR